MDIEAQVEKIFLQLTLEQKCALLHGRTPMSFGGVCPELPEVFCADGPQGVRMEDGTKTTALPCGIALAATWDTALAENYGAVIAAESKACGVNISLGPGMNLMRTPLCGRNFEYYGEDPVLAGRIAAGYVRGCQALGVGATPKHLALNNQEICRTVGSSNCSLKTLRELYCEAFEIVIREAKPWLLMNSYNRINGTFASEYKYTNQTFAKDECGFDGVMVTDWGGCHAAKEALYGGTDLEMGGDVTNWMNYPLQKELSCGKIFESDLDDHVKRVIRLILRLAKVQKSPEKMAELRSIHRETARRIGGAAAVLLKNRNGILPLDLSSRRRILICGPSADFRHNTGPREMCGGSGACHPDHDTTFLEAAQRTLGGSHELRFAPALRFSDVQYLDENWITSCTCEYFKCDGDTVPFRTEQHDSGLFNWNKGDTATLAEDTGHLDEPFGFRITLQIVPDRTMSMQLRLWHTRGVQCRSIKFDGREIYTPPALRSGLNFGEVLPQEITAGTTYTLILTGWRNVNNGGTFNLLCDDGRGAELQREALELAASWADQVIYIGGSNHRWDREGLGGGNVDADIPSLDMCDGQSAFLAELCRVNPDTVVGLINGSAMAVEPWADAAGAIVEFWYPGQETGDVICDILTGTAVPEGRLPFTWGRKLTDYACHANGNYPGVRTGKDPHVDYDEGIFIGYRHFDRAGISPRFPFGFGLNYTQINCASGDVTVAGSLEKQDIEVTVSGTVTNCGNFRGSEVVQLYLAYPDTCPEPRPVKVLRNFVKIAVSPGESRTFELKLHWRDLAFFDGNSGKFTAVPGTYRLLLGRNAGDVFAEFSCPVSR